MKKEIEVPVTTLCKIISIVVHADEMLSDDGHGFDKIALQDLLKDEEVKQFIKDMGALAPVKRTNG